MDFPIPVWVEARLKSESSTNHDAIKTEVLSLLQEQDLSVLLADGAVNFGSKQLLQKNLDALDIVDSDVERQQTAGAVSLDPTINVYQLSHDEAAEETLENEEVAACQQWTLPSSEFAGIWDSLVYDSDVKTRLLSYATAAMILADKNVDPNIVTCNRVVLLHGPPGTGKTSLCKALAQKLSIRMSTRFRYGYLVEINAHSLFSKWFSESGKLVMKLFATIRELTDDPDALVCVLMDEVESLTTARTAAISGAEPSDSIRVVNALLTQIDQIKAYPNVLILTTSNITGAIDLAFVDRADIKHYIGPPGLRARYNILSSCVQEYARVGIIEPKEMLLPYESLAVLTESAGVAALSMSLLEISKLCDGLSGRALRKLPFLALVQLQRPTFAMEPFLTALRIAVVREVESRHDVGQDLPTPMTEQ